MDQELGGVYSKPVAMVAAILSLLVAWPGAPRLRAQAPLGAAMVSGAVRDEYGAVIVHAKVVLTEESKGLIRESASDDRGSFLFPDISAGIYTVAVSKEGFSTWQASKLTLVVGQRAVLDAILRVGELHTVISVSGADAPALDTESNAIGSVIDSEQVRELPLNGRNFLQLALLAGGAADVSSASDILSTNVGHPGRVVVLPGSMP